MTKKGHHHQLNRIESEALATDEKVFIAEQWMAYTDARIATSHDYSGEKARVALALMDGFVDDAIGLYQTMSGEGWE